MFFNIVCVFVLAGGVLYVATTMVLAHIVFRDLYWYVAFAWWMSAGRGCLIAMGSPPPLSSSAAL